MGNAASEHAEAKREELEFMKAVYEGAEDKVAGLLQSHPDVVNARSKDNQNAWHYAAHQGHVKILEMFHKDAAIALRRTLEKGGKGVFSVDQQNKKGQTPLMLACEAGSAGCVEYLIRTAGADPWMTDGLGFTCLHYAAVKGHTKCIEAVLASDPEPAPEAVNKPLQLKNALPTIQKAFEKVAFEKVPEAFSKIPEAFQKLQPKNRHAAGEAETSRQASEIDNSAAEHAPGSNPNSRLVNARTKTGLTPLHCAVYHGHVEAAEMLLAYGSRLVSQTAVDSLDNVSCNAGSTPLHLAAMRGNEAIIRVLMKSYVAILENPSAESQGIMCPDPRVVPDNYGSTPFSAATNFKHSHIIHLLDPETPLDINPNPNRGLSATRSVNRRSVEPSRGAGTEAAPPTEATSPKAAPQEPAHIDVPAAAAGSSPPPTSVDSIINKYLPVEIPSRLLCPITGKLFEDPVVAEDGNTYERSALQAWMKEGKKQLPSGCDVTTDIMLPNNAMKADITTWRRAQKPEGST